MATSELQQIRHRINQRKVLDQRDRERQKVLVRQRIAEGRTWSEVQEEAGISRMQITEILHGKRPRSRSSK